MSSPPTIEIDELVKPISADAPGGVPLQDALKRDLDAWRKEPDPDFPETSDLPPPEWGRVINAASEALTQTGKDLTLAVRLVEALTKKHGVSGLRDGLNLLTRLATDCWEYIHPVPDPGEDQEARLNRIEWLNNIGSGAKFPTTVLRIPIVRAGRETFSTIDWIDAARHKQVEEESTGVTADALKRTLAELTEAREALKQLGKTLDEKMGSEAPNFSEDGSGNLGNALSKCFGFVHGLADLRGLSLEDAPPDAGGGGGEMATDGTTASTGGPAAVGGSRDQLYHQLGQIAATLKRIEPHSPIPYLLERCVRLGGLPFPDMMRDVIRDSSTLDELDRLLGITPPE